MKVVVTGAAGFIGRATVRRLLELEHRVMALVRDPERARGLLPPGTQFVASDLSDVANLTALMAGADGVIHLAGSYRVGIRPEERAAMEDANVGATERVLDAAIQAGVGRIVHVSTVNTYGDTGGRILDETATRDPGRPYLSWYDETKVRAQQAAESRTAAGAPIVICQPGTVYGSADHSSLGEQLDLAFHGRLRYVALGQVGMSAVHVDDVARGIVDALARGRIGESYVLGGECLRLREAIEIAAEAGGHRPPRVTIPTWLLRLGATLPDVVTRGLDLPGNLHELIAAGTVTYWVSSDKARRELGYDPRTLAKGLVDAFGGQATPAGSHAA